MPRMFRVLAIVTMLWGCGDDGAGGHDAGLDAQRRLAITVDGPAAVAGTRSVKVTITSNGSTRTDSFAVAGLPSTVDVPQPIQLSDWDITVDGFDMTSTLIGRGMSTVPSLTAATTVTLTPL